MKNLIRLIVLLGVLHNVCAYANDGFIINDIVIKGNIRVESSTITNKVLLKINGQYSENLANKSLKQIYSTNLFSDISVTIKNQNVIFTVTEYPLINEVILQGNSKIKTDILKPSVMLKSRSIFSKSKVRKDAERLLSIYHKHGRYNAKVTPKIAHLSDNRINLVYDINEGKKTHIQKIYFSGNKIFPSSKLAGIIKSKTYQWYNFLSKSDSYNPDLVEYDKGLLKKFYSSMGYADFRVISVIPELSVDKTGFILTYVLDEGIMYRVRNIHISSEIKEINPEPLYPFVNHIKDKVFNGDDISSSIYAIDDYLEQQGYIFSSTSTLLKKDTETGMVDIEYVIQKDPHTYIRNINITGNLHTSDKVIRREFRLSEGDPYHPGKIDRSKTRLEQLDFFKKIDINEQTTDEEDQIDISVNIQEQATGSFNIGLGLSTDSPIGRLAYTEKNLFGSGRAINIFGEKSDKIEGFGVSYTEPYILGSNLHLELDASNEENKKIAHRPYSYRGQNFSIRPTYELDDYSKYFVSLSAKTHNIYNVNHLEEASYYIRKYTGKYIRYLLSHGFAYDNLDSIIKPTRGYKILATQSAAGILGNAKFIEHSLKASKFIPMTKHGIVLEINGKANHIVSMDKKKIHVLDRYTMGGADIRGFRYDGVGPRDQRTDEALGGTLEYLARFNAHFQLGTLDDYGVTGLCFADIGNLSGLSKQSGEDVYDKHAVRMSAGIGIRSVSALGAIEISAGIPIMKEKFDKVKIINFNFGAKF